MKTVYMLVLFLSAYFWLFTLWFLFFKRDLIIEEGSRQLQIPEDRFRRYHREMLAMVFVAGLGWCAWLANLVGK